MPTEINSVHSPSDHHTVTEFDLISGIFYISHFGNGSAWNSNGSIPIGDYDQFDYTQNEYVSDEDDVFLYSADICLALLSCLNLLVNICLLLLSFGFVRNGCSSSVDSNQRRPHYGLHLFIFNCAISAVLLESISVAVNIGHIVVRDNIFIYSIESPGIKLAVKKTLEIVTYSIFNVTHLNFVLLLNVDKLLYILRPLHYHQLMNRRRVFVICILTWFVALGMASPCLTYLDVNALRQEAILFAMCILCPAGFDLLSAIIVSTIVFRIQLRDSNMRRAVLGSKLVNHHQQSVTETGSMFISTPAGSRGSFASYCTGRRPSAPVSPNQSDHSNCTGQFSRRCNVFLRTFTPIIWTCISTLPYTSIMIYLYFGSDGDEDFIRRWTDPTTFKTLRAFGCLYVTYFTGIPFVIIFNYLPYRRKLKVTLRRLAKRLHRFHQRVYTHRYQPVAKQDNEIVLSINTASLSSGNIQRTLVTAL